MKPTEQDIQAELDRHGLGWNITSKSLLTTFDQGGWFEITHKDYQFVIVFFRNSCQTIDFCIDGSIRNEIEHSDFLTGNYDLSAISQHYEPEEWQRIITMCERIVRLITGTEQTLEEDTAKPSYSDLEQRAEDLEKELAKLKAEYKELDDEFETTHQRHCQARKAMERYQAEMLDLKRDRDKLATNYQRECEHNAELIARTEDYKKREKSLEDKIAEKVIYCQDLEAQLQNSISEEDHEREMQKWENDFGILMKMKEKYRKDAMQYRQWWESEYAKNAEASQ